MIEFGKTLRAAREAKGLSVAQIAEATRMLSSMVENLEKEDFSSLPAPIYGRGFVKLYCEQVGLDPKPMIAEFMEIYNGARDIGIKEKPLVEKKPVEEPPVQAEPPPAIEPLAASPLERPSLFEEEPSTPPQPDLFTSPASQPLTAQASPAASRFSRYASPISDRYDTTPSFRWPSPATWRAAALAVVSIALIWAIVVGIRALYRATTDEECPISSTTAAALTTSEEAEKSQSSGKEVAAPAPDNAGRKMVNIPPLYTY